MSIAVNAFHDQRVFEQYTRNLIGLQRDMNSNAQLWKTQAQAALALPALQAMISASLVQYQLRLQWMTDLQADSTKLTRLQAVLARMGMTTQDVADVALPLRSAAIALNAAPRTTFAEIITACDALLAAVNAPPSLWPE